ncbi:MAG: hypothetical protein HW380_1486, partial [Magnetococcales bacterium]|nr:hypothetical protein [Magnetococcales bacterium]
SSVMGTIHVDVSPDADAPELVLASAAGREDTAIPLDVRISLGDQDGSESIQGQIVITDVPDGATLSLGVAGADHTWIIPAESLAVLEVNAQGDPVAWNIPGLTVTPPENSGDDFSLGVRVTVQDGADLATVESRLDVAVAAVADAADLVLPSARGDEDQAIPLDLSFSLQDQDGSERLSGHVVLTDVPEGATLSVGQAGPGHTWVISQEDLVVTAHNAAGDPVAWEVPNLTVTPPANSDVDFSIGVRLVTMDGDQARVTEGQMDVVVDPQADAVSFSVPDPVPVVDDPSRSGAGSGSGGYGHHGGSTKGGSKKGGSKKGGSKKGDDHQGGSGKGSDHHDSSSKGSDRHGGSKGGDDDVVPLGLQINLEDTDGSESLSGGIVITGVPAGAVLNMGTPGADGHSWVIGAEFLAPAAHNAAGDVIAWSVPNLGIIPPEHAEPGFQLGVQVSTRDGDSVRVSEGTLTVDWEVRGSKGGSKGGSRSGHRGGHGGDDQGSVVGTGEDVLELRVAKGGRGNDGEFILVVDGETVGHYTTDVAHNPSGGQWDTITIDNLNLSPDKAHDIQIQPVHANSHILVDLIEVNGVALEAERDGDLTKGVVRDDHVKINNGGELVFSLPAVPEPQEEVAQNQHVTGSDGHDVISSGAGDDVIAGMAGDDVIGGGAGNDQMDGGDGNDLFIIGNDQGRDKVNGGDGDGWVDAIHLEDVGGGPVSATNPEGNWTLQTDFSYSIDEASQQIRFDNANASGTITLEDGTLIEFDNLEMIGW